MAVSRMKKLMLVALSRDTSQLIRRLMWMRCVEVTETKAASDGGLPAVPTSRNFEAERASREREAQIFENSIAVLKKYRTDKMGLFAKRTVMDKDEFENSDSGYKTALSLASRVSEIKALQAELNNRENKNSASLISLDMWRGYELPLDFMGTQAAAVTLGVLPSGTDIDAVNSELSDIVTDGEAEITVEGNDTSGIYVSCICHRQYESEFQSALVKFGFLRLSFKEMCGTPELSGEIRSDLNTAVSLIGILENENAEINSRRQEFDGELSKIAADIKILETAYDTARTYAVQAEAQSKLYTTEQTVMLTAWVPMRAEEKVAAELERFGQDGSVYYEFSDPAEGEEPPVLLINRPLASPFESVVGLYSLPAYGTFDPTAIMSLFYFVIFGLMLGDFVYGFLLTVGGFLALKFLDLSGGVKRLVKMFAICGISCMAAGILFGSYLGDLPSQFVQNMLGGQPVQLYLWFDMIADPVTFLIVSFVIGAVHLFTGMGIQFYILCSEKRVFDAIFDIGSWYVLFGGIIVMLLADQTIGAVIAIIGVLMLILTQGRAEKNPVMKLLKGIMSLYDIVSYMSDLLSYSRIMALGLASAVIAQVVNLFATMGGSSIVGWIMFPLILILGHTINLVINLLGTFVHTARLQYIEFFGKFFQDGGKPFKPVEPATKYTLISEENH